MQTPTNPKGEKRKGFLEKLHALYNKEAANASFDSWVLRELLYQQVQTNELLRQQVSELQNQNAELKQQNLQAMMKKLASEFYLNHYTFH